MASLIQTLPKAELHIHIEGSLEPEMMFNLAQRNGVKLPYGSVAEVRDAYQFEHLQSFFRPLLRRGPGLAKPSKIFTI